MSSLEKLTPAEKKELYALGAFCEELFEQGSMELVQVLPLQEQRAATPQFSWLHLTPNKIMSCPKILDAFKSVYNTRLFYKDDGSLYAQCTRATNSPPPSR